MSQFIPFLQTEDQTSQAVKMPTVWTIAGSDNAGFSGIQADLKSFQDLSVHACTCITANTSQTGNEFFALNPVDETLFEQQWRALLNEHPPSAIKIGLIPSQAILESIVECLQQVRSQHSVFVVCDPVVKTSSGGESLRTSMRKTFVQSLLPYVDLLTPNIDEFLWLSEGLQQQTQKAQPIRNDLGCLEQAVVEFLETTRLSALLITGGHDANLDKQDTVVNRFWSVDKKYLNTAPASFSIAGEKQPNSARGTGCRLSSAIAALMAHDFSVEDAITLASAYVNQLIAQASPVQNNFVLNRVEQLKMPHLPKVSVENNAAEFEQAFSAVNRQALSLYPVVDDVAWIEKLLPLGIQTIQLRLKNKSQVELEKQIARGVALQNEFGVQLFINDYWQLAIKHKAFGVHLGQEDLFDANVQAIHQAGLALGVSTHGWWELSRAATLNPSYIAIGPVYPTTTKTMPFDPQGLLKLKQWVALIKTQFPSVAIGGINKHRIKDVLSTGVDSIAVVSAICAREDYQQATQELLAEIAPLNR